MGPNGSMGVRRGSKTAYAVLGDFNEHSEQNALLVLSFLSEDGGEK